MVNTKEHYAYIDKLVEDYQSNDKEKSQSAAEQLLSSFYPYIVKFMALLGNSLINFQDKDIRKFISLFIEDNGTRKALLYGRMDFDQRAAVLMTVSNLVQMCSFMEPEELTSELNIILLTLAKRYQNKGISFAAYVNNAYYFWLSRHIKDLIQDPLIYQSQSITNYYDEQRADPDSIIDNNDEIAHIDQLVADEAEGELSNAWIVGITCSSEFLCLSSIERLILKYHFSDGYTYLEIGERLGLHKDTVRKKCRMAVETLRKELKRNAKEEITSNK